MTNYLELYQNRLIGYVKGNYKYLTVIAFGGIHGNEIAGVKALENVISSLESDQVSFRGNFYAIKGNLKAINENKRFIDVDLNRIWTRRRVNELEETDSSESEISEQKELYSLIKKIVATNRGPYYFLDLHTTSSNTSPFITISDSLNNRKFSYRFKLPIILGIEEYLNGPLLTFLNEFGHISLGFEAGKHEDENSIRNCESFVWLALAHSRCITRRSFKNYQKHKDVLKPYESATFYHILEKYTIQENEDFKMEQGFTNFQKIEKGKLLAHSNGGEVRAEKSAQIFMPLYQKQGEDGFFIISKLSSFWLNLSRVVRKLHLYKLLPLLPGVKKASHYTMRVNPKTANILTTEIFHLFGYRMRVKKGERWFFTKRDRKVVRF